MKIDYESDFGSDRIPSYEEYGYPPVAVATGKKTPASPD